MTYALPPDTDGVSVALGKTPGAHAIHRKEKKKMSRNLKALGLAMVAVFALSAMAASAAQATNHHLTVPETPAIITAEDTVNTVFSITNGERKVTCTTTKYEGRITASPATSVTVRPTYSGCSTAGGFVPVTVDVNDCAFILTGITDVNGDAVTHLECATGNDITLTYSLFGAECIVHVTPQTPSKGVSYTQAEAGGKKHVTVGVTVTGITYHETANGPCPGAKTGTDGTLEGTVTAKAYKDNGSGPADPTTPGNYFNEKEGAQIDLRVEPT